MDQKTGRISICYKANADMFLVLDTDKDWFSISE